MSSLSLYLPLALCLLTAGCHGETPSPTADHPITTVPGLLIQLPESWESETPSSSMRAAQAKIPGKGQPGELSVFYFGKGQGGSADANLQRWIDQVETAPGITPQRTRFESNGLLVTWVDIAGTIKPSPMGAGPAQAQPRSRLLGAVVEGPGGPWFFKATGPDETLAAQRDAFVAMLRSARPAE